LYCTHINTHDIKKKKEERKIVDKYKRKRTKEINKVYIETLLQSAE